MKNRFLKAIWQFFISLPVKLKILARESIPRDDLEVTKNILVLLVEFEALDHTVPDYDLNTKYNNNLSTYVQYVSYGQVDENCTLKGWYRLPKKVEYYQISVYYVPCCIPVWIVRDSIQCIATVFS